MELSPPQNPWWTGAAEASGTAAAAATTGRGNRPRAASSGSDGLDCAAAPLGGYRDRTGYGAQLLGYGDPSGASGPRPAAGYASGGGGSSGSGSSSGSNPSPPELKRALARRSSEPSVPSIRRRRFSFGAGSSAAAAAATAAASAAASAAAAALQPKGTVLGWMARRRRRSAGDKEKLAADCVEALGPAARAGGSATRRAASDEAREEAAMVRDARQRSVMFLESAMAAWRLAHPTAAFEE